MSLRSANFVFDFHCLCKNFVIFNDFQVPFSELQRKGAGKNVARVGQTSHSNAALDFI